MSRKYKQIDNCTPSHRREKDVELTIDWNLCALCQDPSNKAPLTCPANGAKGGTGYAYVAQNLIAFREVGEIPITVPLSKLDEGSGFEETFRTHQASWHKSCRTKVSKTVLDRKRRPIDDHPSPVKTRRLIDDSCCSLNNITESVCFFCNEPPGTVGLHRALTLSLDSRVREHAERLNDGELLRKLSLRDMVAQDSHYHKKCLSAFYRRVPASQIPTPDTNSDRSKAHSFAFAEIVAYIENFRDDPGIAPVFSMAYLSRLYSSRLSEMGFKDEKVHSTRLRQRIEAAVPDLTSKEQGRDVMLVFDKDIGNALKKACTHDSEVLQLLKAVQIIRKDILQKRRVFDGKFSSNCQEESVPASLKALVSFILDGTAAIEHTDMDDKPERQAVLTLSQLISFNCRKIAKDTTFQRHKRERETPLPIYLGLKLHAERKKGLIDTLSTLGLSISYDRVMTISSDVAHTVCKRFEDEKVVVPTNMRRGLFTAGMIDNIDHNPTSTTASDSFHGTSMSLIQHRVSEEEGDEPHRPLINTESTSTSRTIPLLPAEYTDVLPVPDPKKDQLVPQIQGHYRPEISANVENHDKQYEWLKHVLQSLETQEVDVKDYLSWAAFHASLQHRIDVPISIIGLLPLLMDNAHSTALIKHAMRVVRDAVLHLNPGQTSVLVMDQPLYALAKCIQWCWPDTFGEKHFVIMLGGLHTEMTAFKTIGDWLKGSGWNTAITVAGIASSGVADSLLKAAHLTRTRHAHQVTAVALYILQWRAHAHFLDSNPSNDLSFEEYCKKMTDEQPQFAYWATVLDFELTILQFVFSVRSGDFRMYTECLTKLMPWMFAMDHVNYARWLSVHIRDMTALQETHPEVFRHFCSGAFVARKTKRAFSAIALDQAHEQCNAVVKGEGGVVGLTNSPGALRRWMIAGPDISRMVLEFEEQYRVNGTTRTDHREQRPAVQAAFAEEVKGLVSCFEEMGNPFMEDSGYLFAIDSKNIMTDEVIKTVRSVLDLGHEQYTTFIDERFEKRTKPLSDPIKKNKLPLFSNQVCRLPTNVKTNMAMLRNDCSLFSRLYIACQTRDGNLEEFFRHENQPWPPSLSKLGHLRPGSKADLLACLTLHKQVEATTSKADKIHAKGVLPEDMSDVPAEVLDDCHALEDEPKDVGCLIGVAPVLIPLSVPQVDAKILDGAAVVQMLSPKLTKTFEEYVDNIFLPHIYRNIECTSRLDIVFDVYHSDSLKASTRESRGCGVRRRVLPSALLPSNWHSFLRVDDNKTELIQYIAQRALETADTQGKTLVITCGDKVMCVPKSKSTSRLHICSHDEADTRILLHLADCVEEGLDKILIRTTDTDVLVLAVASVQSTSASEIWVALGTGKNFKYVPAHEVAAQLGPSKSRALPAFHAFTGCDTVSFFNSKGKTTAWKTWSIFPEVTDAFLEIMDGPCCLPDRIIETMQRFVVLMYDRSCVVQTVDEARQKLFAQRGRRLENIPPTSAALRQHLLRAVYQAGHVWGQCLVKQPVLPSPADWGWKQDGNMWTPVWTTLQQAQQSCYELIRCGCKQGCRGRCKCVKANLQCTALCDCGGDCCQD